MNWQYEGKDLLTKPEDMFGFIYLITYTNGNKYIGQKKFCSELTVPALLNGEVRPNSIRIQQRRALTQVQLANRTPAQIRTNVKSGLVPFDIVSKESKWQSYKGSSKDVKDLEIASKEILYLVPTKRNMTYREAKALFIHNAIEAEDYLNANILGKFFRGNLT